MKLINQTLTHQQMQHLRNLGLDTSDASLVKIFFSEDDDCPVGYYNVWEDEKGFYTYNTDDGERSGIYVEFYEAEEGNYDHSERKENSVYTLADIIAKLPERIERNGTEYFLNITKRNGMVSYDSLENSSLNITTHEELLVAAYITLCWVIDFGYLKEEKK